MIFTAASSYKNPTDAGPDSERTFTLRNIHNKTKPNGNFRLVHLKKEDADQPGEDDHDPRAAR
ncbi:MAG: hypothetical protein U0X92_05295 [Anaerolineales bacterium]